MAHVTGFDDLLFSKTPPVRTSEYVSASMVLETLELTSGSVKAALSPFEQEDLGTEDAAAMDRALSKAAWWILAKLRNTRHILEDFIPDESTALQEIIISRAIYELALATGQSGKARERRTSIEEMAIALFGADFRPADATGPGGAVGVVAIPVRKRYPE